MIALLKSMKSQFAEATEIVDLVGDKCRHLMEFQDSKAPYVTYVAKEERSPTKDGSRSFTLILFLVHSNVDDLLVMYEACREVMDVETTGFQSEFIGSTFPITERELDDNFIIELTYTIT